MLKVSNRKEDDFTFEDFKKEIDAESIAVTDEAEYALKEKSPSIMNYLPNTGKPIKT